jgi:hypothetical protein
MEALCESRYAIVVRVQGWRVRGVSLRETTDSAESQ